MDHLLTRKPNIGLTILDDFNQFDTFPMCNGNNLKQVVSKQYSFANLIQGQT